MFTTSLVGVVASVAAAVVARNIVRLVLKDAANEAAELGSAWHQWRARAERKARIARVRRESFSR